MYFQYIVRSKNWPARAGQFIDCFLAHNKNFYSNEKGATALEYVLIVTVLSSAIVIAFSGVGQSIVDFFGSLLN